MDETNKKFEDALYAIYKICKSLIFITEWEHATFGQEESIEMAKDFISDYEADYPEMKEGD